MRASRILPPCALVALCLAVVGCDLELDASRPIPAGLARRVDAARAEVAANPSDAALQTKLGGLYLEAGRYFEAAETLKSAREAGADTAAVHAGLAETYLELGYFQACGTELRGCFQKNRDEPGCLFVFGSLMDGIDDRQALEEAQRSYRRLLAVAPDFRKAKLAKSALDQVDARLDALPKPAGGAPPPAGAAAPAPAGANPHAGVVGAPPIGGAPAAPPTGAADPHAGVPGAGGAAPDGQEIGGLNPFGAALMKAIDAVRKNDAPAAEAAFTAALAIRPNDAAALAGLAEAQFAQGKKDAAVATIEKAYTTEPTDPQVRWAFGRIMIETRLRMPDAIAAWKSLLADEPDYAKKLGIPARLEAVSKFDKVE